MRNYKRKTTRGQIPPDVMDRAIKAVADGQSVRSAATEFGIDRMTLKRYIAKRGKQKEEGTAYEATGRSHLVFSPDVEKHLGDHLKQLSDVFHGLSVNRCCQLAFEFAKRNGLEVPANWERVEKASQDWWLGFKKRQKLTMRQVDKLSDNPAQAKDERKVSTNDQNPAAAVKEEKQICAVTAAEQTSTSREPTLSTLSDGPDPHEGQTLGLNPKMELVQVPSLSPGPGLKQETPETPQIKEEPEEQSVKQEEEQLPGSVPESSAVCVKTEEEPQLSDHTDHDDDWTHPYSPAQTDTESDGDHNLSRRRSVKASHQSKTKHWCPFCSKGFGQKEHLHRHIRVHTGEKPFSCTICKAAFSQEFNLQKHQRTHTGEKPFSCSLCDKSFALKNRLELHMRTHTLEKPYSCSICKKTFAQKGSLTKHMIIHTGDKPYRCSICEKSFAQKGTREAHVRTHTGEKPYSCSTCKRAFAAHSALSRHMWTHVEKPNKSPAVHFLPLIQGQETHKPPSPQTPPPAFLEDPEAFLGRLRDIVPLAPESPTSFT